MAATVQIDETNGTAPGVVTNNIANTNYGAVDAAALDPVANPIIPASNSFQKWQQFNVTALGGSVSVRNLKHFASAPAANATHKFNGNTVQGSYDTSRKTIYETPDQTDGDAPNTARIPLLLVLLVLLTSGSEAS